jgi:alpha-tubulin suppressor-like RCC1 family protein
VWAWGGNSYGQLGDGTTTAKKVPTLVPGLTGIVAVAAGAWHTLALSADGFVWAWGSNSEGQLGDGTTTQRTSPVSVPLASIVAVAAGDAHSVALAEDGTVWVWGRNSSGQLGDGTTTRRLSPQMVLGVTASAVAAGYAHTAVVGSDGSAWAWGANGYWQLGDGTQTQRTTPVQMAGVTGAVAVAAGHYHTLVLRTTGSVLACGMNTYGQLGDGTSTSRATAVSVTGLSGVVGILANHYQSAAILTDGTVRVWGYNGYGVLGDGTTTSRSIPIEPFGLADVGDLAFGQMHAVAITTDGTVFTWGSNSYGQLGDGTNVSWKVPSAISEAYFNWLVATPAFSVSSGTYYTPQTVVITDVTPGAEIHFTLTGDEPTALDPVVPSGGSVLIDQTTTLQARAFKAGRPPSRIAAATYTPAARAPTFSPTGGTYAAPPTVSMSTTTPGSIIRYTTNGTNPTESSAAYDVPLTVSTSTTLKAATFRTGWSPSTVTTATYTMNFGTLAPPTISPSAGTYTSSATVTLTSGTPGASIRYTTNGTTPTSSSPLYTEPLLIEATTTLTGRAFHPDYTASASSTGAFTIQVAAPVFTPPTGTYLPQQAIVVATDTVGATIRYTLNGTDPTETSPIIASGGSLAAGAYTLKARAWKAGCVASSITAGVYSLTGEAVTPRVGGGNNHSLALRGDGIAWSWGSNTNGQLGDGTSIGRVLPVVVNGLTGLGGVSGGSYHSVALRYDGTLWSWGGNSWGQLGDGTTTSRLMPVQVLTLATVTNVAAGDSHTLAVKEDGTVWAWGLNNNRQLGDGTTTNRSSPVLVPGLSGAVAVAAGGSHSLALKGDGTVWAWGNNGNGQLGDGTTTARSAPVQVASLVGVVAIAAGGARSLAITSDGSVWQWGQVLTVNQTTPQVVPELLNAVAIAAGVAHSMALTADGTIWCWGSNANGQLGDGTLTNDAVPTLTAAPAVFVAIAAGGSHSLALAADGTVWTWGRGTDGQLGDGLTITRSIPAPITEPGMVWRLAPPTFSVPTGRYSQVQEVSISCSDPTVVLHYTLSGADPQSTDPAVPCEGTVAVTQSATLKASAWKTGAPTSVPTSATYELKPLPPTLAPPGGTYVTPQAVAIASDTPGVTLRYTLDGADPTTSSSAYSAPIEIAASVTVKAIAFQNGWTPSDSGFASYWIPAGTVEAPALSPGPGVMATAVAITLTTGTPGAAIRYTLDGSEPSASSSLYTAPILIERSTTVRARAFKAGYLASPVSAGSYQLEDVSLLPPPIISPAGGRFAAGRVAVITGPAGATLRYTVNGAEPTLSDPEIASGSGLAVSRALVLKVRAWSAGQSPSTVARADFLVTGAVAAGRWHTLALAGDGTVFGWGSSYYGQVGNGR